MKARIWPIVKQIYIQSFSNKLKIFTNKLMWKLPIQYIVLGFEPTQHESHPITTRPWLPTFSTKFVYLPSWTDSTYCLVFQKRNSLPLGPIRAFISFHKREPKWRCWTDLPQRVYSQRIRHLHGRVEKIQKRSSRSQRLRVHHLLKIFWSRCFDRNLFQQRQRSDTKGCSFESDDVLKFWPHREENEIF